MTVDILILGAGWLSTFLIPLCKQRGLTYAATTRDGRDGTLTFVFDASSDEIETYRNLPDASTVLITFPIIESGGPTKLVNSYAASRRSAIQPRFLLLGATNIWEPESAFQWYDRHSPYNSRPRAIAEQELLDLSPRVQTTVLNLAGLWGGSRTMRNWVGKVAGTKDALAKKGSLHMIHGLDVSRAILAIHTNFTKAVGQRWLLTDDRVYDWWDLASAWGARKPDTPLESDDCDPQARWACELMREHDIRALPRNVELLGRALDSREFWETFELNPLKPRLD
ncbi:hypothetical protein F5887DRAFT_290817 [Amanita rubescens]|nr:hypothetical protein F5887DRAFT_290817 [Amanita rubescens]